MTTPAIENINLLQRRGPTYTVVWWLLGVLALSLAGLGYYGGQLWSTAREATRERTAAAEELRQAKGRLDAANTQTTRSAGALEMRRQLDALEPQSLTAQALLGALRTGAGNRGDDFARPFDVIGRTTEQGVWLTSLAVADGGRRLELKGQAREAEAVLRYVRRLNDALQPLGVRLDSLEIRPGSAQPGETAAQSRAVTFQLS